MQLLVRGAKQPGIIAGDAFGYSIRHTVFSCYTETAEQRVGGGIVNLFEKWRLCPMQALVNYTAANMHDFFESDHGSLRECVNLFLLAN